MTTERRRGLRLVAFLLFAIAAVGGFSDSFLSLDHELALDSIGLALIAAATLS